MNPTKPCILAATALAFAVLFWTSIRPAPALASSGEAPRLILLVAVDQMRYDYLPRFADAFTGGFGRLMRDGAVFTNAHLDHYPSVTAVGHAAMLSGAPPSISGIIGNDWYDRALKRNVSGWRPSPQTLNDPKSLYQRPWGASGSESRQRLSW